MPTDMKLFTNVERKTPLKKETSLTESSSCPQSLPIVGTYF
jgi:hypothetical protein